MSDEQQSGKMWSGRFREPLDSEFEAWQRSIVFDWRLLDQEVAASKAHASALSAAGILSKSETVELRTALDEIAAEFGSYSGRVEMRNHASAEDIHHFVELKLIERVADLALRLHTGRSRNEQVATDLRLYVRAQIELVVGGLAAWAAALVQQGRGAGDSVMPSYTHLQRAEPVLVAHWLLAYVEMALRDADRLLDCAARLCASNDGWMALWRCAFETAIWRSSPARRAPSWRPNRPPKAPGNRRNRQRPCAPQWTAFCNAPRYRLGLLDRSTAP